MPTPPLSNKIYEDVVARVKANGGNVSKAGLEAQEQIGTHPVTFEGRAKKAREMGLWGRSGDGTTWYGSPPLSGLQRVPTAPDLPDDDIDTNSLIEQMCRRFTKRRAHHDAKKWRRFDVPVAGPYALMIFGDPHIDDDGCDWPLLRAHCQLAAETEGLFAVNIGDTTNNWSGRLARLWSEQDTGKSTARKLVKWLLNEAGVPWWLWLLGNHDSWPGPVGSETMERFKPHHVVMEDWGAKVTLVSPNGAEFRLHAAHDFSGHSQWNPLHGPMKEAKWGDQAHVYVAGHKHNWALFGGEHEHKGDLFWLARAKGYKTIDSYAERLGFGSQGHGNSILVVVDPGMEGTPGHVSCFADPIEGVEYLKFKRAKR
jgi:hypothetical protein